MALLVTEPDQLQVVRDRLHTQALDSAGALRAFCAVQAVLSCRTTDHVMVDAFPEFAAIVIKGSTDKAVVDASALVRPVLCHSQDVDSLQQLVAQEDVLPWDTDFLLTDCEAAHEGMLQAEMLRRGRFEAWPACAVMTARQDDMQDVRVEVPQDYRLCPVPMEAAPMIQSSLPRRPKGSLGLVQHEISHCPSSCVLGPAGDLVAYALSHARGGVSLLDVHPSHQGLGLARCVLSDLAIRLQERGEPVWACVDARPDSTQARLFTECGFRTLGECRLHYFRP